MRHTRNKPQNQTSRQALCSGRARAREASGGLISGEDDNKPVVLRPDPGAGESRVFEELGVARPSVVSDQQVSGHPRHARRQDSAAEGGVCVDVAVFEELREVDDRGHHAGGVFLAGELAGAGAWVVLEGVGNLVGQARGFPVDGQG